MINQRTKKDKIVDLIAPLISFVIDLRDRTSQTTISSTDL